MRSIVYYQTSKFDTVQIIGTDKEIKRGFYLYSYELGWDDNLKSWDYNSKTCYSMLLDKHGARWRCKAETLLYCRMVLTEKYNHYAENQDY